MRKYLFITVSILVVGSLTLLFFNYTNYRNNMRSISKIKSDITNEDTTNKILLTKSNELKSEYEALVSEKDKKIKEYEKWESIEQEVKEYLS